VSEPLDAVALRRDGRNRGDAELVDQLDDVDADAIGFGRVGLVERDDERPPELEQLAEQE
jgi:hypothetical protein